MKVSLFHVLYTLWIQYMGEEKRHVSTLQLLVFQQYGWMFLINVIKLNRESTVQDDSFVI